MDTTQNQVAEPNETAEDVALEAEALVDPQKDAVRAKILEEIGLADVEENAPYIEKLVQRELDARQKLATAIKQKIGWRNKAKSPKTAETPATEAPKTNQTTTEDPSKLVDTRLNEILDQEKLQELELSEESKKKLKAYAKAENITVRQALKTDYFTFLSDSEKKAQREEDASAGRSTKSPAKTTYSLDKPPQVDMSTPEGQAEWDAYMKWATKQ